MGRPKGALNRRTREFRERYEREGFRDPLMFLGWVISQDSGKLAREFKCKKAEVLPWQIKAAQALAPYLHSRMPQAVHVETDRLPLLVVGKIEADSEEARVLDAEGYTVVTAPAESAPPAVDEGAELPLLPAEAQDAENQRVTECGGGKSDGEKSDE